MRPSKILSRLFTAFAVVAITAPSLALADKPRSDESGDGITVEAQPLATALQAFSEQSGLQIAYVATLADNVSSKGTEGADTPVAALSEILESTGLEYQFVNNDTVAIGPGLSDAGSSDSGNSRPASNPVMLAQNQTPAAQSQTGSETSEDDEEDRLEHDKIVVTGTRIKGVKDQFSPVTQISREEMDLAGFNNVSDIFETLPQNFGGDSSIDTALAGGGSGVGRASVNLRGLGSQATLILLNGHRMAGGGLVGRFVDLSTIPASAIDRVDVLTDGASAIYGSDAIAGVVNIILRDEYEGAETRLNVGTITDGGGDYLKAGQTLGWSGYRAHAMVTYEYSKEKELDAKQKDFAENEIEPTWLLPDTEKNSVFTSAGVQLTDRITLSADGFFNDRKSKQFTSFALTSFEVFTETDVQQYGGAFALDLDLTDDWEANLSGSYSKSDHFNDTVRDSPTVTTNVGEEESSQTEILSFDGTVGGPLFNITDDPVKVVIGGHYRNEAADLLSVSKGSGRVNLDSDKSRDVFSVFGEFYAPIISDSNRMPGVESLALSVAARYEKYSDVGTSLDPKVGLAWSPVTGLNLRGTYGTSFRAPRLDQLRDEVGQVNLGLFVDPVAPDGESVALLVFGSGDDLDPERSRTWTAGFDITPDSFDYAPDFLDGFRLRATYFNTEFRDQVGIPSFSLNSDLRITNFTGIPIRDVTAETALDLCARSVNCINLADFFPSLGELSFEDVEVLLDNRRQNLSFSKVAGFDFEARYDLSSAIGDWQFTFAGTRLTTFEQRVAPATPIDDLLNTFGNPAKLRLRGGVRWRTGSMTTSVFVNHTGNYTDDEVPGDDVRVDSFTTADASIRLDLGELGDNPLTEGAFFTFSATNFLNEDPPRIGTAPLRGTTFDAANANPAGRKIGILLTKRF